jgi:endonuclease G, mitochondrial
MDVMPTPPQLDAEFQQRVAASRKDRMNVARNYLAGNWLNVAGTRQTYDRLVRKGHRHEAEQLLHLADRRIITTDAPVEELRTEEQLKEIGDLIYEAIIGSNDIMPVNFLHQGSKIAYSVGRIITFPRRIPIGTGFLISPCLLLTNCHVLANQMAANTNIAQFNFYAQKDGSPLTPAEFRFKPDTFFLTNPVEQLDWCLVAVETINRDGQELAHFGWNNLIPELGKAQQGERLNIIHHPQGRLQEVSIRENFLAQILERFLHYVTDTEPGSSGSPVYNEEWEVVALHHAARRITDQEEIKLYLQILRRVDPNVVDADAIRFGITINEGVRVSQIVNSVKEVLPSLSPQQRSLLEEALRGVPPPDNIGPSRSINVSTNSGTFGPMLETTGAATWTIPLNISVNLGASGWSNMVVPNQSPRSMSIEPSQELSMQLELYQNTINSQRSVFRALAYLQESREEDYLPQEEEITANKKAYYGQLIDDVQNGIAPDDLYDALNVLLNDTLRIVGAFPESLSTLESLNAFSLESGLLLESDVEYARARAHLYTWVDLREDRMLRGVYTNVIIAPEQLMLKDIIVQLGQLDLLPRRFRNNQFLNCEHIVPQSWFNKQSIGVSDLHHLITADGAANNFRSDYAYRDLADSGETGPDNRPAYIPAAGRRNRAAKHFEPAQGKAIVARATLYFILAHKGFIDNNKYGPADIEILKEWAKSESPGAYELHRNETIFAAQGNRNPLIDFPEWIDHIDFMRGIRLA